MAESCRLGSRQASLSVELLDVAALDLVEAARVPDHHDVARLLGRALGVHAALHREPVALARVALGAGGDHVVPRVRSPARDRLDVVAREAGAAAPGGAGLAAGTGLLVFAGGEG